MKVVSAEVVLSLLESRKVDAELMVRFLATNHAKRPDSVSMFDLDQAKSNLASIERTIKLITEAQFEARELFPERIA